MSPSDETPKQSLTARLSSSRDCGENTGNGIRSVSVHVGYEGVRLGNTGVNVRLWAMRMPLGDESGGGWVHGCVSV